MSINAWRWFDEAMASEVESLSISRIESLRYVMNLLANMLQAIAPMNLMAVKDQVIVDLVDRCRVNQTKLLQLLTTTADEGLLALGLKLNDALQRMLAKPVTNQFVLSASHGCMLQYALFHLASCDSIQEEDLKSFCQRGSWTLGHPANLVAPRIEVTTGTLGHDIATAVGLLLAERPLTALFDKLDLEIVDHYIYVIREDGCQMEGVSNEAYVLARHWDLVIYSLGSHIKTSLMPQRIFCRESLG
ncbi:hypothetical protein Nepgr_012589 [Nepenthes gracilis]|uniref:GAT domain-containing protein n=1 Tax=Nepenthes gracilis TaxID=150966 RepID=A0AAD3SG97_NEPGR|nr:hypothetical protein Nepgr_012589 [Nepenthes gracilis]